MKKRLIALGLAAALCASVVTAWATGGSAGDPLISLSYLKNTYKPQMTQALQNALYPATTAGRRSEAQITMDQQRYKQDDVIQASTGCEVIVLAGNVSASFSSGGVLVNATDGTEIAAGKSLTPNARYVVGEDTLCALTIVSPTAVVSVNGAATLSVSTTPDYNAMAKALQSLSLLKGTGSGYGEGFDLELRPSRIEAMILFIRLLGEEDAALACTAKNPFSDVPAWADRYAAYAYQQGYSNGVGDGKFGTALMISPQEYVEFILRALGYSSTSHTDLSTTLNDARTAGVLTRGEYNSLRSTTLLRAHLVYISYYALSTPMASENSTLADQLIRDSVFTASAFDNAQKLVTTPRL